MSDTDEFRERMHREAPAGYEPCTRPWPHDGPCAHALAKVTEFFRGRAIESEAAIRDTHNLLAYAIAHRTQLPPDLGLLDCARRLIELLEETERVKAAIQADSQKAHEQHLAEREIASKTIDALSERIGQLL